MILILIYPLFCRKDEKGRGCFVSIRKNIENYLIFQPSKLRAKRIQRKLLKKIEPHRFINQEGIKLYSWFVRPQKDMPVILHLHGQAESILTHQDIAIYCKEKGLGLFMLSYRGHYKSWGKASEQGVYNDAQDAIQYLKKLGVEKDKIILWGHSLGTAIAIETATKNDILGLILQSPIKEIKSAAIDVNTFYCKRLKFPILGKLATKHIEKMDFVQKMDGISKIKNVKCPILILHSKTDRIAPFQNSIELANENPNSEVYISEKGTHWDAFWCFEKVFEFVQSLEYNEQSNIKR